MEMSPDKRRASSIKKGGSSAAQGSPMRNSQLSIAGKGSVSTLGQSPRKTIGYSLDINKKTGQELRESPSKNSRIVMKYINSYADVGPILPQKALSYTDL